ncbi:MAG: tripartite tricarboxylate transporter substrate-binding protein [Rhodospirillaceae bacterium]
MLRSTHFFILLKYLYSALWSAVAACAAALPVAWPAHGAESPALQPYPARPLRLIVASSAGTASDYFARVIGDRLASRYRQQVVIDNRPGAGGLIGNTIISRAGPDGHTLAMVSVTRVISELLREDPPYSAINDVVGVAHVATITNVLTASASVSVRTLDELIAYARSRPGELNYASVGIGSSSHLAAELFTRAAGLKVVHVPYRSLTDAFVEMHLGRVHYSLFTVPAAMPFLREGKVRALAVTTPVRSEALPDVPTMMEAGLPEAGFENWSGIVAPVGTPRRIVEQLHGDIVHILRTPGVKQQFARQGAESMTESTPDGFMRLMRNEYLRYERVIRQGRIHAE